MAQSRKQDPKIPPKKKVRAGAGITAYQREETLLDPEFRDAFAAGEPVPRWLRPTTERPFVNERHRLEKECAEVFADYGLPHPFKLIPDKTGLPSMEWRQINSLSNSQIEEVMQRGYRLSAQVHCPVEDHSSLWYAARIAWTLARLDVATSKAKGNLTEPAESVITAAHLGYELGRLENEYSLKLAHEKDALLGKRIVDGRSKAGRVSAQIHAEKNVNAYEEMRKRIARGESKSHAAHQIVKAFKLEIKPQSFVKNYNRHAARK